MSEHAVPEVWVRILSEKDVRAMIPPGKSVPYDFGAIAAMARLLLSHAGIGPAFLALYGQIMFAPGRLSRQEREMIAAVTSAAQDCHY